MKDALGDRMKAYESAGPGGGRVMPLVPTLARLDGNCFHSFTKGLYRPFDERLMWLMVKTAQHLAEETNANMTYTQSDEITLAWLQENYKSEIYFDGKHSKLVSILAAKASVFFNKNLQKSLPEKVDASPVFDCRVWSVPNKTEAANVFIWREKDATRNSISLAAQSVYSHKELQGKSASEMQEMLFQKGINWNDYHASFKRGTYIQKKKVTRAYTFDEIKDLPMKHEARRNPNLEKARTEFVRINLPILTTVVNREEVIFDGAEPIVEQ